MDPSRRHHSLQDPNTQLNWTFEVVLLFSYQLALPNFVGLICFWIAKAFIFYHSFFCLSRTFFFLFNQDFQVKRFVVSTETVKALRQQLLYYIIFSTNVKKNLQPPNWQLQTSGEEGIWTLAPLLTTYSLSRRAPSASWVLLRIKNSLWYILT